MNSLYQRISVMNTRRLENLSDSKQDILTYITLSRFLDFLPPSCYNFVVARHPTSGREAATLATEFFQNQQRYRQMKLASAPFYSAHPRWKYQPRENGQQNNYGEHTPNTIEGEPMGVMHGSSLDGSTDSQRNSGSSNHFSSHTASNSATDFRSLSNPRTSHVLLRAMAVAKLDILGLTVLTDR